MRKLFTLLLMVCISVSFAFGEDGERKLVVKPVLTSRLDVETDWGGDAAKAAADSRYELTKVEGTNNLYKATIALKKYFISNKWKSSLGTTYPTEYPKEGWEETHQFVVVYQDEYGDQENKNNPHAAAGAQAFLVPEENTEITFYAIVNEETGVIRSYCDARSTQLTIQNNDAGNAIFPTAVGKTSSVVAVDIASAANKKIEIQVDANITHPTGAAGNSKLAIYSRGRHAFVLDFLTMQYQYYQVLDAIQNPKLQIGTNEPVAVETIATDLGVFSSTNPLTLGGQLTGKSTAAVDATAISAAIHYTIIPAEEESENITGSIDLPHVSAGSATSAVWYSGTSTNISDDLADGTYTLKVSYQTNAYGDILVNDQKNETEYTTTFTVDNTATTDLLVPVASKPVISSENGTISVTASNATTIKLYAVSGQLLNATVANKFAQSVAKGIYILSVNGENYKIIVK